MGQAVTIRGRKIVVSIVDDDEAIESSRPKREVRQPARREELFLDLGNPESDFRSAFSETRLFRKEFGNFDE